MTSERLTAPTPFDLSKVGHWSGTLSLTMQKNEHGKTVIADKQQVGPYTIQRPFYPEYVDGQVIGVCHLILLHPPGGLVEGDSLNLTIQCLPESQTCVTTPSAGKVYECESVDAAQKQIFHVCDGASLEWFPQETIVYNQSLSALRTEINLEKNAHYAGWEILCLGRPIAEDYFAKGRVSQSIELKREGKPLLIERIRIDDARGNTSYPNVRKQSWGMFEYDVTATLIITDSDKALLTDVQSMIVAFEEDMVRNDLGLGSGSEKIRVGVTLIDDVLVCRALAQQSRYVKTIFTQIWLYCRHKHFGLPAVAPRIWAT